MSAASVPTAPSGPLSKRDQAKTRKVKRRAANQEAGDKAEQVKDTEARQRRRAASQAAGDRTEREKNTEARQRKRAANQAAGDRTGAGEERRGDEDEARRDLGEADERLHLHGYLEDVRPHHGRAVSRELVAARPLPGGYSYRNRATKRPTATSPTRGCR